MASVPDRVVVAMSDDRRDDDLGGPITQHDINANADWGEITCYDCDSVITEPGGAWVQMRPFSAYPFCATCLTPDPGQSAKEAWGL